MEDAFEVEGVVGGGRDRHVHLLVQVGTDGLVRGRDVGGFQLEEGTQAVAVLGAAVPGGGTTVPEALRSDIQGL